MAATMTDRATYVKEYHARPDVRAKKRIYNARACEYRKLQTTRSRLERHTLANLISMCEKVCSEKDIKIDADKVAEVMAIFT